MQKLERLRQPSGVLGRLWRGIPYGRKYAFLSAFVLGLLTHSYIFTNFILNHEGAASLSGFVPTEQSNLWFEPFFLEMRGTLNAPWLNGLLSLLYLSLAVTLMVDLFDMRSRLYITLCSASMVTFPTLTSLYAYMYAADALAGAFLCSVLAVWLVRRGQWGFLPGILSMALCAGIYPGYLCAAAALCIVLLALDLLQQPEEPLRKVLLRGLGYALSLTAGLALYFLILYLAGQPLSIPPADTQGIPRFGAIVQCYVQFFRYFLHQDFGLFPWALKRMNLLLVAGTLASCAFLAARARLWRRPLKLFLLAVLLALFPLAANADYLLSDTGTARYNMSLFPMVMAYALCIVLLYRTDMALREAPAEALPKRVRPPVVVACWVQIVLLVLVGYNSFVETNSTYVKAEVEQQQAIRFSTALCDAIEAAPGYTPGMPVFRVGYIAPTSTFPEILESSYFFGFPNRHYIIGMRFYREFLQVHLGKDINVLRSVDLSGLEEAAFRQVYAMPSYPAKGSIRVMDGVLYVKLGDISQR